jgi:superfamily II DNA or RNA helicase
MTLHPCPQFISDNRNSEVDMSLEEYRRFIASRAPVQQMQGFAPIAISDKAKTHQHAVIDFALRRGKSAAFLDTGLGKSFIELEFARQCAEETGKPSIILTPLAVAGQMVREGQKFGIDARQIREQSEVGAGVMVANYERLAKLAPASFGAVILDESSILKSYASKTRIALTEAFKDTRFKLAATATPSPNDHTELGNHAEFLDVMRQQEMLSKWFINDTSTASQEWRLKGHAAGDFWQFVASWSRCATLPSDLGGDDTGYVLPAIDERVYEVEADRMVNAEQGMLFRIPEMSATSFHAEKRLTIKQRCEMAVSLVFEDFCTKLAEIGSGDSTCLGSQNTQPQESGDTMMTPKSVSGENRNAEPQKKTPHTCENITLQTRKSLPILKSAETGTTQPEEQSMPATLSMLPECALAQTAETQSQSGMVALSQHMGSPKMTMSECFQIRDVLAQFVVQPTKIGAAKSCTSITATKLERSGNSYAQAATRLSARCETIQTGLDQLSNTWNAIKADPWLVFCETNEEQDFLEAAFGPMAFSVRGSDDPDEKERRILAWCDGDRPVLISKTKIVGFGMNFQHCRNVLFASVNFSYEAFYQGVRRVWRFGQGRTVNVHVVLADTEAAIWQAIGVKSDKHDEMKRRMSEAMRGAQTQGSRRVVYDRPLDLAFPSWIKGETK